MKYYIIAGEASGDLHGSNLIRELLQLDPSATVRCWGGDLMQEAGAQLVKHYKDLAFMGFYEVAKNLPTIFRNLKYCKEDILQFQPDALVLIDYPGFNLRIAKWARQQGLKIIYYISPQVWAWKENRVKTIKECVDKMLVILPFEREFYKKWGMEVEYVGHPLVEVVERHRRSAMGPFTTDSRVIALLPGSRKQEILKKLPVMLETSLAFPQYEFIVAKAPGVEDDFYLEVLKPYPAVKAVQGKTYDLLMRAKAALVTSGTATLETALFGVPEVVCYKGSAISFAIAKRLVKIKYICLVNLIMDREVVKELIQNDLTVPKLSFQLQEILSNSQTIARVKKDYLELRELLGKGGHASANAAESIYRFLKGFNAA